MNLQSTYFDIIHVENNPFLTNESLLQTRSQILHRRKCPKHYSTLLQSFRPVLFEHLVHIYFHPEITILMQLIIGMQDPRRYHIILKQILYRNIRTQFPYGDNHVQLMNAFINSTASKSLPFLEF